LLFVFRVGNGIRCTTRFFVYGAHVFLRGSVTPFPAGFCCRQVAIMLLRLLGITMIISLEHLILSLPSLPTYLRHMYLCILSLWMDI
jgi:hypothetical protein